MLYDRIFETAAYLSSRTALKPGIAVVLGSGLGQLTQMVNISDRISYADIPNFPQSTVDGHAGELLFGTMDEVPVLIMSGRFHYYEGYSMQEVTFPIRVMKALGVHTLLLSNASGGMNTQYEVGDIVFIKDHINLFPEHPLRGRNDERLGTRFPDMSEPYNLGLLAKAKDIARKLEYPVHEGVYAGLQGPSYETRAEYKWLHGIGADIVGMSTVPEVIVAVHSGLKVFAASIVADIGIREELNIVTHEDVLEAASRTAPRLSQIFGSLIKAV
jgi:purine-nucleoside phosphorylase